MYFKEQPNKTNPLLAMTHPDKQKMFASLQQPLPTSRAAARPSRGKGNHCLITVCVSLKNILFGFFCLGTFWKCSMLHVSFWDLHLRSACPPLFITSSFSLGVHS